MSNSKTITRHLDYVTETRSGASGKVQTSDAKEFENFAELAGKLAQVPKKELDEKRKRA
jgi:hypothetical protein